VRRRACYSRARAPCLAARCSRSQVAPLIRRPRRPSCALAHARLTARPLARPPPVLGAQIALIGCLLQRDITRRFGNLKDGVADIKRHVFFSGFNWERAIEARGSLKVRRARARAARPAWRGRAGRCCAPRRNRRAGGR
jgi:hypothetical protein